MKTVVALLLAVVLAGCVINQGPETPVPTVAFEALAKYDGVYSSRSEADERTGNRSLGLYGYFVFPTPAESNDEDSVRITTTSDTLVVEALKDSVVIKRKEYRKGRDFILTPEGLRLSEDQRSYHGVGHSFPGYVSSHSEKILSIGASGDLVFVERSKTNMAFLYVIPTHGTSLSETAFRRISAAKSPHG